MVLAVLSRTPRLAKLVQSLQVGSGGEHLQELEMVFLHLSNLTDFRILLQTTGYQALATLRTLFTKHAALHPQPGLRTFALRMDTSALEEWPTDLTQRVFLGLLSSLPPTIDSLILDCPPITLRFIHEVNFSLTNLHLSQRHFDRSLFDHLTQRSQATLSSLIFETPYYSEFNPEFFEAAWERPGESCLTGEILESFERFPLRTLGFLGFEYEESSDIISALAKLPSSIRTLKLPDGFDVLRFLESESCPKLSQLNICGDHGSDPWYPALEMRDQIKQAGARRGIFLVPCKAWEVLDPEELEEGEDEEKEGEESEEDGF
ncbi:hypothetical protein P7C70_g56, partial [Phenoliferia sp. Uapishka_3]